MSVFVASVLASPGKKLERRTMFICVLNVLPSHSCILNILMKS